MIIKPKFNINDLIQHKFCRPNDDVKSFYEIIDVQTITCCAGTQVFYHCRLHQLHFEKQFGLMKKDKEPKLEAISHRVKSIPESQYTSLREDEVKACSKDITKHIK